MLLKKIAITVVCLATTATYHHLNALEHYVDACSKRSEEAKGPQDSREKQAYCDYISLIKTHVPDTWLLKLTPAQQQQVISLIVSPNTHHQQEQPQLRK